MRLIVTRPLAQAADWVQALRELGHDVVSLPLMDIAPADDPAPVRAAWRSLADVQLVMFVSANAVQHFFAQAGEGTRWPAGVRAACTGPGTAAALQAAGVPASRIVQPQAERLDSEALWAQLRDEPWAGRRVLVVRGEDGRDWLADTWRAQGAQVDFVAAYRRLAPRLDNEGVALLAQARAESGRHLWLFSSSEAVGHLQGLAPAADWSQAQALASHPRIAQAARDAGFGRVVVAPTPSPAAIAAVAAAWPSIQSGAL